MTAMAFRRFGSLAVALVLAAWPISPTLAQNQDVRALVDQIERLRRDVDVLQRQIARSGGTPPPASSSSVSSAPVGGGGVSTSFIEQTDSRFADLDTQLRDVTGRLEEMNFKISQLTTRLDKLVSDIDFRLSAVERGGAPAPSAAAAPTPTGAPATAPPAADGGTRMVLVPGGPTTGHAPAAPAAQPSGGAGTQTAAITLPQGSPEAQYEFAYGQLLQAQREQGDFGRAEQALRAFIAANSSHRLAGNAQYWLGETYYVRRDYQNAAVTFAEGFQKYPNSEKAPDNLLKLGMSLGQLNQKQRACGTFGELERRYPQATASIKQATQREKQRLGCT